LPDGDKKTDMQLSDSEILDTYKEVFHRFAKDGVIDMDKRLKHKFSYTIHRLENVIPKLNGVVPPNRQSISTMFRLCPQFQHRILSK
jgi:hypothetical protein